MSEKELEINDFEKNKIYKILVSNEDYDRALSDHQFANSLPGERQKDNHQTVIVSRLPADCKRKEIIESLPISGDVDSDYDEYVPENIPPNHQNIPPNHQNIRTTNVWSYNQTICLINSMATCYSDFNDPRKRKHIFEHVANDIISAGFMADAKIVQNKWKGLLRSYTKAKDTKNRTGQGPSRFLFYELIDDIVGNHPKNSCSHSLNSLDLTPLEITDTEESNVENTSRNDETQGGDSSVVGDKGTNTSTGNTNSNKKRKKSSENQTKKEYIELKREEYARRQKRHEEKCTMEKERNEIERKKLTILEEYLRHKTKKLN